MMTTSSGAMGVGGAVSSTTHGSSTSIATTGVTSSASSTGSGCTNDSAEPNDTQANALDLGILDPCIDSYQMLQGVLDGQDIDWYQFTVDAAFFCFEEPDAAITSDGQARLCMYFECEDGPATVTCPAGTQPVLAPQGQEGCCGLTMMEPDVSCNDVTTWLRVDKPSSQLCVAYEVSYRF